MLFNSSLLLVDSKKKSKTADLFLYKKRKTKSAACFFEHVAYNIGQIPINILSVMNL